MDALVLREINPQNEIAVLESGIEHVQDTKTKKEVTEPNYIVDVIHHDKDGTWLARKVFFSRTDLQPRKQIFYDKAGNPATIATYDNFTMHDNIMFPSIIEIKRPKEEYTIQLGVVKVTFNQPLRDDQFELQQPPGSQLQVLDGASYDVPIRSSQGQARQSSRVQQAQR
jgi:hypothetical protein